MKSTTFLLATTLVACTFVAMGDPVSDAANNPAGIKDAVVGLNGKGDTAFASDVIAAISAMSKSPTVKLTKQIKAAAEFISLTATDKLPEMVTALISEVPFENLPEWTNVLRGYTQSKVSGISDDELSKIIVSTLKNIGSLKDFSNDDKSVISVFALKLFARGSSVEEQLASIQPAIKTVPASYSKPVADSISAVLAGDYTAILGDTPIVYLPDNDEIIKNIRFINSATQSLPVQENAIAIKKIEFTPPAVSKPPVPEVYANQF